jgi:hypothetical protein
VAGNAVLVVGAVIAAGIVIDYGVRAIKPAFTSTSSTSSSSTPATAAPAIGSHSTGLAGADAMLAAATAASAANAVIPYSTSVNTTGLLAGFRSDCSGFVSWVVSHADPSFGDQTTDTIPSTPGVSAGAGQYVTLWDRPQAGAAGHVIIEILGQWFESGGDTNTTSSGGPTEISQAQAETEIQGGMSAYHLAGM